MIGRDRVASTFLGLFVAGCTFLSEPLVSIEEGLVPRMTPVEVAAQVIDHIREMELVVGRVEKPARVLDVTATTAVGIGAIEPRAGGMLPAPEGILWLVRAEGTFTNPRAPGARPPIASSGYFVISDADGVVVTYGFS